MAIKLIIFDFDGVLVDSEFIAGQTIHEILLEYGVNSNLDDVLHRFVGMHNDEMRGYLAADVGENNVDEFLIRSKKLTDLAYAQRLSTLPHAAEILAQIKLPKCICSNSRQSSLIYKLGITKLDRFFTPDMLYVGSMVPNPKPAPDLYLYTAKKYNILPSECLVIEDSVFGIRAAVAANMPVIGFYGASHCYDGYEQKLTTAGASLIFDDLLALPKLIDQF
ncbi:MAG: HAD family phosphatase [Rhizobiales bacterium]|nr:HAD family phosphatase [Hyphomicrobiales bacterium]